MQYIFSFKTLIYGLAPFLFYFTSSTVVYAQHNANSLEPVLQVTHETSILFIATYKQDIYSLDTNALLKMQKQKPISGSTSSIKTIFIGREALQSASFHYPLIIAETKQKSIILYSISEQKRLYAFPSDGNSYAISNDNTILAFSHNSNIAVIDLPNREIIKTIPYTKDAVPPFIALSTNKKNIMLYYSDASIEYLQISTGRLLQKVETEQTLFSPTLNASRRYIIGHNSTSLVSIDAVNGNTISKYFFTDSIKQIRSDETKTNILVLSEDSTNEQTISFYSILRNGKLILNDDIQISGLKNISSISQAKDSTTYIGRNDGLILVYNSNEDTFSTLYANRTQAIYDATFFQDSLVIAKSDALISIPMKTITSWKNNRASNKKDNIRYRQEKYHLTVRLQYNSPRFIPSDYLVPPNSMFLLSQDQINPILYVFNKELQLSNAIALQFIPDQVFTLSDKHILYHQNQDAFVISQQQDRENMYALDTNQLLLTLQTKTNTDKDIQNNDAILWINTALHNNTDSNSSDTNLELWPYSLNDIRNGSITPHPDRIKNENKSRFLQQSTNRSSNNSIKDPDMPSISFPYNVKEISYINAINVDDGYAFFLIAKTTDDTKPYAINFQNQIPYNTTTAHAIHLVTQQKNPDEKDSNKQNPFSLVSSTIATIEEDDILHILPFGKSKESIVIFTKYYIRIIMVDTSSLELSLDTRMQYPDNFGIIRNVAIYQNYIAMIDTYNSLVLLELINNTFQKKAQLLLSKDSVHIKEFI